MDFEDRVLRWLERWANRLPGVAAVYFCVAHGLMWLVLWLGLPMAMMPSWMELWLWRLFVLPMLLLVLGGL